MSEGNLVTLVADGLDTDRYQTMGALIKKIAPVGLIYGSNVSLMLSVPFDFIRGHGLPSNAQELFWKNLCMIGDTSTPVIDGREHPTEFNGEIMVFDKMDMLPLEEAAKRAIAPKKNSLQM